MSPIDAIENAKELANTNPQRAKELLLNTLNQHPEYHQGWALLAAIHKQLNEHDKFQAANKQYEMIAWFNNQLDTAQHYLDKQNPKQAEQIVKHLLQLVPNEARALLLLANIAYKVGDNKAYLAIATHNLEVNSSKPAAQALFCQCLLNIKQFEQLILFYKQIQATASQQVQSLAAAAYVKLMKFNKAASLYKKLLEENYFPAQCHLRIGNIEKIKGNTELAIAHYKKALEFDSNLGEAYWNLANLKSYLFDESEIQYLSSQLHKSQDNLNDAQLHFALAKAYEQQELYDLAFNTLKKANAIQKSLTPYQASNFIHRCKTYLTQPPSTNHCLEDLQLVFIVSLPRSGSTLVEQILASHPHVDASYELTEINAIARELESKKRSDTPYGLDVISDEEKIQYANRYLNFIKPLRGNNPVFIDKQPINFHHVALIKTLFPNAKIIEVKRDKAATAWSLYKHLFSEGHAYSYDFTSLAQYINDYHQLMAHWHSLYPDGMFTVDYQQLINEFDSCISQLLTYCGLDMHENCLKFYENQRPVMTPSSEQVRQPIYKDALTQWTHYQEHLAPLLKMLD
ncbi:sulfotransferase family protein [Pseudoalteromonas sp. MEBiC 03607]|uniref:tetratricopeptide repeat-containing sulfotransferase family protein n=1 Tax=Pseudoalteromonas sp. MEBiC 03607 TaxID=2563601 RepID=UPI001093BA6D|nr:tetratricopeptide repeat-containing sulfotransferase family protein [Pseudoalteromonas sp. MEBiC 03607]TGV20935.1 sulfotransferase family protein [Pseudoalteromonas sp. MEBiC 03607]